MAHRILEQSQGVAARVAAAATAAVLFLSTAPAFSQAHKPDEISVGTGAAGALNIVATSDIVEVRELLERFSARNPGVKLTYLHKNSLDVYADVAECSAMRPCPDIAWSSAMDLQIKLVNDGHALRHETPDAAFLPPWAVWRSEAYGVTAEPIVLAYNKALVPPQDVPRTRADFIRVLQDKHDTYRGKVAAYDPERSGTGYLFWNSDMQTNPDTWRLVRAIGGVAPKFYSFAHTMLDRVSAGDHLFAYNMISSYALARAEVDPAIGFVALEDYALVMTRIALIPRKARHPAEAGLFLDFLLSREGQGDLARRGFGTVRVDMPNERNFVPDPARLRPIHVGPELLTFQDQAKRRIFFRQWRKALESN